MTRGPGIRKPAAISLVAVVVALVAAWDPGGKATAQGGTYVPVDTWRSADDEMPAGTFRTASGVALAADGRAIVSDALEGRISAIHPDESVSVFARRGGEGSGPRRPGHLAFDPVRDRLYAADREAGVVVLDGSGAVQGTWPGVAEPAGIGVASDGSVVVADAASGEVVRFDPDGARVGSFAVVASAPGGGLLRGLAVDSRDRVYVLSGSAAELLVHGLSGSFVTRVRIDPPGVPATAFDVAVDEDPSGGGGDLLWFASSRGLLLYDAFRGDWTVNPLGADLTALAVDRQAGVFVTFAGREPVGGRVLRLPYGSAPVSVTGRSWSGFLLAPGVLDGPEVISIGVDGRAYVLDRGPRIQRFTVDGRPEGQVDRVDPAAVAAYPDGTLVYTDGGTVRALAAGDWRTEAPSEVWSMAVAPGGGEANAVGLAFEPSTGGVAVLDAIEGSIRRFSAIGTRGIETRLTGSGAAAVWADLGASADGTLHVLDRGNGDVHVLSGGSATRVTALPDPVRRIAVDGSGALFGLGRDGWVRRYDASGNRTAAFDATRFDIAAASAPSDVAATASGDLLVTDRRADIVTRFAWDPGATPAEPPDRAAQCRYFPGKTAAPGSVDLWDDVEVRLFVRGGCGSDTTTELLDIVLVLDRSGSMEGDRLRVLKGAALNFAADVNLGTTRLGVVSFHDDAELEVGLTDDAVRIRSAIVGLEAEGGTRLDRGLYEARVELGRRARRGARAVFVVLSDGGSSYDAAKREADLAKGRGVEIYAVGIQAWEGLMREVASDDDHYFAADSARFLYGIFERIAERVTTSTLFRSIEVVDRLPENMTYVTGSAEPTATWDAAAGTLTWQLADVPFTGFALRYLVRPGQAGDWPTNVEAWADYVDGFEATGRLRFPVPTVSVRPGPPTPVTPSATPTPSTTPTASATPTVTSTPTATVPPEPLYLPVLLREPPCEPGRKRSDVVLVIDTSSSMAGDKIAAAREAALRFLSLLALPEDKIGVVAFDNEARLESPLTGDAESLRGVVLGLGTRAGTRIDLGLQAALEELEGPRHDPARTPVIVLLTDGRQDDAAAVLAQAARARAARVVVFAIGLGSDVDAGLLTNVAGSAAQTYLAPGPGDLADIYARIAVLVPCPPEQYWGRR